MLEGIQVLNETIKWTADEGELVFGIILGLGVLFFLLISIAAFKDCEIGVSIAFVFLALFVGFGSFTCIDAYVNRESYSVYQVIISDSVKLNEFNTKYNIIKQEGNIYTIREKDIID